MSNHGGTIAMQRYAVGLAPLLLVAMQASAAPPAPIAPSVSAAPPTSQPPVAERPLGIPKQPPSTLHAPPGPRALSALPLAGELGSVIVPALARCQHDLPMYALGMDARQSAGVIRQGTVFQVGPARQGLVSVIAVNAPNDLPLSGSPPQAKATHGVPAPLLEDCQRAAPRRIELPPQLTTEATSVAVAPAEAGVLTPPYPNELGSCPSAYAARGLTALHAAREDARRLVRDGKFTEARRAYELLLTEQPELAELLLCGASAEQLSVRADVLGEAHFFIAELRIEELTQLPAPLAAPRASIAPAQQAEQTQAQWYAARHMQLEELTRLYRSVEEVQPTPARWLIAAKSRIGLSWAGLAKELQQLSQSGLEDTALQHGRSACADAMLWAVHFQISNLFTKQCTTWLAQSYESEPRFALD